MTLESARLDSKKCFFTRRRKKLCFAELSSMREMSSDFLESMGKGGENFKVIVNSRHIHACRLILCELEIF